MKKIPDNFYGKYGLFITYKTEQFTLLRLLSTKAFNLMKHSSQLVCVYLSMSQMCKCVCLVKRTDDVYRLLRN